MKQVIKVSIIVPVYNVQEYLSKCLNSLVNQTLKDIEIIIVNDGTKDDSEKIINKFLVEYPSLIKYYKKENGGLSSARNYGIKYATGEYIGFVDSDDYVELDMYEKLYNKAVTTKTMVTCCGIKSVFANKIINSGFNNLQEFTKTIQEQPSILLQTKSYAWNKLYNRKFWINNNFMFPNQYFEDSAIMYQLLYLAGRVSCVNEALYVYKRDNLKSISKSVSNKVYDIFKSCDSILSFYKKLKDFNKYERIINDICIGRISARITQYMETNEYRKGLKFVNYAIDYLKENIPNYKDSIYYKVNDYNKIEVIRYRKCLKSKFYYNYLFVGKYIKKRLRGK